MSKGLFHLALLVGVAAGAAYSGVYTIAVNADLHGRLPACSASTSCVRSFPPQELFGCDKLQHLGESKFADCGGGSQIGFFATTYNNSGFVLPNITLFFNFPGQNCKGPPPSTWNCFGGIPNSLVEQAANATGPSNGCTDKGYIALDLICMKIAS
jgi:hypothetical protein